MEAVFLQNLTSPPLLCFFLGLAAALARSDLDVPNPVARALSLYLLFAIGFKGGSALAESALSLEIFAALAAAILLASVVPLWVFFAVRRMAGVADAAAIAATYGSISAVTFVTAVNYLDRLGVPWGGHFVAAMALMEAPAIVIGLFLYRRFHAGTRVEDQDVPFTGLLREALLNGSVVLILGSLLIGWLSAPHGAEQLAPFVKAPFVGILCLFLLDMGLVAARRLQDAMGRAAGGGARGLSLPRLSAFALLFPLVNGALGLGAAALLGLGEGDALLLTVLAASASYIAVPAAMRLALPEANPSVYLTMALAVSFPFNILIGIPLFHSAVLLLTG